MERDLLEVTFKSDKMAPRPRSEDGSSKPRRKRRMPPPGTEEYVEKRGKNNVAVRKSREKTRVKARETIDRVSNLREENRMLEQQVEILSKELTILKDLFKMMHNEEGGPGCPGTDAMEIAVQTEGGTSPISVLDDPALMDLKEVVAPAILDTRPCKTDHQYVKLELDS